MFASGTPSSVMYDDLRLFGGISNKDAARILLSARVSAGGKAPRDRVDSRTYLSREVVHVRPGSVDPYVFADFHASTRTICTRIVERANGSRDAVAAHYAGDAAHAMASTLVLHGLDGQLYLNESARLQGARLAREADRATLLVMLFCATGCLADPRSAVGVVEEYARHRLAQDLATFSVATGHDRGGDTSSLGLMRVEGDVAVSQVMPLSPEGTVIGTLASGESRITNVGLDVSRTHLRVWMEDGRWLCQGMGSTNGTVIESGGADKDTICVEPPRTLRSSGAIYPPQELREGDTLCLGKSTRFLVMRVRM